jgi:Skp family chaperone for outer membrane proteins
MRSVRFLQLGWVLFFAVATGWILSGFQAPVEKVGVADINRMMDESDFGKSVKTQLDKMRASREEVLQFIDNNRVITIDQATQIRDLTIKPDLTTAERAQLDSIKATVVAANFKWKELATKTNMTPEERTLVQDYADRAQKANTLGNNWVRQFTSDIDDWVQKQKVESNKRARAGIQQVAKQQSFSVVYDSVFVPFGANDITDTAIQAMNAAPK